MREGEKERNYVSLTYLLLVVVVVYMWSVYVIYSPINIEIDKNILF